MVSIYLLVLFLLFEIFYAFIYLFLAMIHGKWDLSSPAGVQTLNWKLWVLTTGLPGTAYFFWFYWSHIKMYQKAPCER